tara:strand:+ start:66 stop:1241 length:1176 start_codon:yes stop_codon:yes gene_type:complete
MEIKVRELTDVKEKSKQEIEQELLDKHEQKQNTETEVAETKNESVEDTKVDEAKVTENVTDSTENTVEEEVEETNPSVAEESSELSEEQVLSYIGNRWGEEVTSLDQLKDKRDAEEPLSEDVAAYLKYKKETGRNMSDYLKLQKDYSEISPDNLLREYLTITEEGLDPEDIDSLMEDYVYDEDDDDENVIKKVKLAKKKMVAKAKKYFNQEQQKYKLPLESRESSGAVDEDYQAYKQYISEAKSREEIDKKKSNWFKSESDKLFSSEFKGFKFNIGDNQIVYSPGSAAELRKAQDTPMNFVNTFLDSDTGLIKDTEGYHRSLAMAMNPDKFAEFFFEQGKAYATEDVMRKTKNVDMKERSAPEVSTKGGFQVKSVSQPSSRGLKIKSIKKM